MIYIFVFFVLAYIIIMAGKKLSICGDKIGEEMGLEKSWVGIIMLASITSLPELITSASSTLMGNPDMAISNIFGSNLFNIFIIFILDVFFIKNSFSSSISMKNYLSAFFSILLTTIFLLGFVLGEITIFKVSFISIILFILYFVAIKLIYEFEHNYDFNDPDEINPEDSIIMNMNQAKKGFVISGLTVITTGIALTYVADKIANTPIFGISLGESFVGVILLALATSLPELTVSIQAIRMGSFNMAAGNILGSNIFNITIVFIADLLYRKGSIFQSLTEFHIISSVMSLVVLMVFMIGVLFRKKKIKIDSWIIGVVYILAMYILYLKRY
ncbi:sodium:calcium antiporter [Ilyobacter polytropus]|uniref:Sodium/calcium exchanger membrane region n=1 Tax=Ilyobacter polytropus (strain ATCC 51220 / DSM 2926 / LMG 16218 / CuHBu1) TaxID=572544 RepID=E3HAP7_ILYPC|nr:sodium:calcium antiporter [Ilyobacter polytropus]ADO83234.1 sodium/calcium exchanger membrane region [Ilyobacter polytropus DSM 2926]